MTESEQSPRRGRRPLSGLTDFLKAESAGGVVLLAALVIALVWANSPAADGYRALWEHQATAGVGRFSVSLDLRHWVNDGLMTLFFLVVGLELKRELVSGDLREGRTASLPAIAAVGGMVLPALLFVVVSGAGSARGWAIPMATDIALVLGVLSLLGPRVPSGLRLFLLTLAIVDDLGAILVIAVFYTGGIRLGWLAAALAVLAAVVALNRPGAWRQRSTEPRRSAKRRRRGWGPGGRWGARPKTVRRDAAPRQLGLRPVRVLAPLAVVVWLCTFQSGVHPTIAGVALGLTAPAGSVDEGRRLEEVERRLHPVSSLVVVPLFALANAGVDLGPEALSRAATSRLAWAVVVGLVVGKTVGISALAGLGSWTGAGRRPAGVGAGDVIGGAMLAGIGFTVSLFVTGLAFDDPKLVDEAKVGILFGSALAATLGALMLRTSRTATLRRRATGRTLGSNGLHDEH